VTLSEKSEKVVVARRLLPVGERLLQERFNVVSGGLEADRSDLLELVPGAAAIVADPTVPVDDQVLAAAGPALRLVANFAVGYDNVDLAACARRGVKVTNTPDVLTDATAELALGLTLAAARQIPSAERSLRNGEWSGWDPGAYRGKELTGSTIGVLGMGRIGLRYALLAAGFAGELIYFSRSRSEQAEVGLGATQVGFDDLMARSDVLSVHLPGTPQTRHMINSDSLAMMKPDALLVNTSRGSLVESNALATALVEGRLGAAALDVFEDEPQVPRELLEAPRLVLTPHIGSATGRSRDRMAELVAANVIAVLGGEAPVTEVSGAGQRSGPD
jgi:glyoxylate reductase